jgi:isopenicillin N synthase-like dioxygenase
MEAMELGLQLQAGYMVQRCIPAASELRMNHYPPVTLEKLRQGKTKRGWPHSDFGIITLLFQDGVGGLELEDRAHPGTYVPVHPAPLGGPSEMVINISDTFQRWSNKAVPVGLHQVTTPVYMKNLDDGVVSERYSNVFFFKASRDTSVGPLPAFVTKESPAEYEEMSALELHKQMTTVLY